MKRRLRMLVIVWTVILGMMVIPSVEAQADGKVIEVNGTQYASIDAAIEANDNGYMNNCTIKLLQDVTLSTPLHLYGTTTLDLNGKTLRNGYGNNQYLINAENANWSETACNLTIKSSFVGGKILTDRDWGTGTLEVSSNASCTIEKNVTIEDKTVLSIDNYGTLTVKEGATLLNNNPNNRRAVLQNTRGNAILEGGSYTGDRNIKVEGGTLTINGGNYEDTIQVYSSGTLVISGGTFNKKITLPQGRTLQDCMKEGCTLKALDSANTIDMDSNTLTVPAKAEAAKVYFTKHPTLGANQASLLEGYAADETATLTVTTKGTGTPTYQWHVKKTLKGGTTTDETISRATVSSYQIPEGLQAGTYEYYCVASYDGETAKSKSVTFTVTAGYVQTQIGGTKKSYASLKAAWQDITDAVKNDKGTAITLTFLEDITGESDTWTMDGTGKTADLTIDLNGKKVTCDAFTFQQIKVTLKNSDSKQAGELNATLNIQDKAALIAENITVQDVSVQSGANAELKDSTTTNVVAGSATGSDATVNAGISCRMDGGIHKNIKVNGGAKLAVTGEAKITDTLQAVHSVGKTPVRAEVTLSGGDYARIQVSTSNGGLEDASKGYAIVDMLAEGYAFYSLGMKTEVARPETSYVNLSVCKDDTQEDTGKAVVKLIVTKKDNTESIFYFPGWTDTLSFLRNQKNAGNWKTLELVLLQDTTITQSERNIKSGELPSDLKITIHSKEDGNPCTLHANNICVLNFQKFEDVTLQNIKIDAGYIRLYQTIMTLEKNTEISSNTNTIIVQEGSLIVNDAKIGSTSNGNNTPIWLESGQLRLENKDSILSVKADTGRQVRYSVGNSSIIVGETAKMPTVVDNSDYIIELNIFCNNPNEKDTPGRDTDSGKVKVWYPITLLESKDELLKSNPDTVKECDDIIYGLGWSSDTSVKQSITVADTICLYQEFQGSPVVMKDNKFTMPAAPVTLLNHKLDDNGKCVNCGKTDLAKAYEAGKLQINGLTGRTYDSWPQALTDITLTGTDGNMTTLTGPAYISGKELAQDSTNTANADMTNADYALVYENNINAYDKVQGESGFDEAKAPKVTITGRGSYTGTVEYYFTIGQGKLLTKDFKVRDNLTYNGKQQGVLQYGTLAYEADGADADTPIKQAGMSEADTSISVCSGKTVGTDGFDSVASPKIAYSTDNGSTWTEIDEKATDESKQNYRITNAGSYDFQIRATDGENAVSSAQSLTATIQPKSLISNDIKLDDSQLITAYYTGKPIIPTNKDNAITDVLIRESDDTPYVLKKGKDFTVSARNNTNVSDAAELVITGKGNYTDTLTQKFSIVHAFELAQTTASKDHWYKKDVPAVFGVDDTTGDTSDAVERLVYRNITRADNTFDPYNPELNGIVKLYTTLEDAVNGEKASYIFTEEGKQTANLYGRDTAKGYIAKPVSVTVQIDKTAPTWADEDGNSDGYGIGIKERWWNVPLGTIGCEFFRKTDKLNITLKANDQKKGVNKVSGIDKYYYYVDTSDDTSGSVTVKTEEELDALAGQGKFISVDAGTGMEEEGADGAGISILLDKEGSYIVYAYAVDNAGNKSDYICTDALVKDTTAPEIESMEAPSESNGTLKDTAAQVAFTANEAGTYYCILRKAGDEAPDASTDFADDTVDSFWGETVWTAKDDVISGAMLKGSNVIALEDLEATTSYQLYLMIADQAGNVTGISTLSFTTRKMIPYVEIAPVIAGIYGDAVKDMKLDTTGAKVTAAKGSDVSVEGKWSLQTDKPDEILVIGTQEKYTLLFEPKDTSTYEATTCEVLPEVAKRPITVVIADNERRYGEDDPVFTWSIATGDGYENNTLIGSDEEDALGITLSTTAANTSNAGIYAITGISESTKYDVIFTGNNTEKNGGVLTVDKAPTAPNMPETTKTVPYTTKTVEEITLPENWQWQTTGTDQTSLPEVDVPFEATAEYVGSDKGNYETESVTVTITRSACTHETTELRNAKKATCTQDGYSGDTYCTICDTLVESGQTIPASGHKLTKVEAKEATPTEAGNREYFKCSNCGGYFEDGEGKAEITDKNRVVIPAKGTTLTEPTEPTEPTTPTEATTPTEPAASTKPTEPKVTGSVITEDKSGVIYKVTNSDAKTPEVEYTAPVNKETKKVVIPDTVTIDGVEYAVTSIAKNAFKNNKKLTEVKIGKNVTSIGDNAFAGCKNLRKVELNENLMTIGKNAFKNCKRLKTITIKSTKLNKKNVKKGAFKGITAKTVIKVPKSRLAAYRKLFRSKGLSKKVRFKNY